MTKANSKLQETLARLSKMTTQKKGGQAGKKVSYFKMKPGKNEIIVLPFQDQGDPFIEWGQHQGLLNPDYLSVPCAEHNNGEVCPVCEAVKELKAAAFADAKGLEKEEWKEKIKTQSELWNPIDKKVRYYSPVIDLNDIEAGVQWYNYSKTILNQFQTWLVNLEEDETPFYDVENPEKVIIMYDKEADANARYKLDKKTLKKLPEGLEDIQSLVDNMESLPELLNQYKKDDDTLIKYVDDYLSAVASKLSDEGEEDEKDDTYSSDNILGTKKETPTDVKDENNESVDEKEDEEDEDSTPKLRSLKKKS